MLTLIVAVPRQLMHPHPTKGMLSWFPGGNEISQEDWDAIKDHPGIVKWLARGDIRIEGLPKSEALEKMSLPEALATIALCTDEEQLMAWYDDPRPEVKKAIEEQGERVLSKPPAG